MEIVPATIEDAEEILRPQKLAYLTEADLYGNHDIPPLKQTLEEIRVQFKDHIFLKAVANGEIIGTVRAYEDKGTCHVGRLAVRVEMRNRGIGTALMREIEKYCAPGRFELFVGSKSANNIQIYEKLGYRVFKKAKYETGDIDILYMEKPWRPV